MRDPLSGPEGSSFDFESLENRRLLTGTPPYANALDNDIAYGADGSLHVAWHDMQTGALEYATRSAAGVWSNQQTIEASPGFTPGGVGTGYYVSLAVDSNNRAAVAFYDAADTDLKYASRDAAGVWTVRASAIETTSSLYPSLAFTTADVPVISYYLNSTDDLKVAKWTGTAWGKTTVDSADDVGRSSSLHLMPGTADRFGIAYEKTTGGDFKYVEQPTATTWGTPALVDADPLAGGGFTSLDYDANNNPAFSYYDSWTSTLKYASRSGSTWSVAGISGRISNYTNLYFSPSDGKAHLVYYDVAGNIAYHISKPNGGNWQSVNPNLLLGGGNRIAAAFKPDGSIAYTFGPPNSQANPSMGIGFQQASLATQPVLTSATTVSNSRVDVAWTFPTNLSQTGFKVGVSTDGGRMFVETIVASASARAAQITGLSGSTAYTFTVRAYNASGDSSGSYTLNATTLINPPAAPSGLSATAVSSSQIDLAWDDLATETGYKIERSLTGTGGWSEIEQVGANVTSYSDSTGLSGNTTYHYRVRATNAGGDSSYSTNASATTLLATPGSFTATAQSTSRITLAWTDVSGETGYKIQRLDSGSTYVDLATVAAGVTAYSVTDLDANTSYTFRVCATSAVADSAYTAPASATTQASALNRPSGTPLGELQDPTGAAGDNFGQVIAASGDLILAANPFANGGEGSAVLIDATNGAVLRRFDNPALTPDGTDAFGFAVAFVGNRIAISAPDDDAGATPRVYIYDDFEDDVPDLVLAGPTIPVGGAALGFGRTLAAVGDDLLVQYQFVNGTTEGEVRRYDLTNGAIEQTFTSPHAGDQIGNAMAVDPAGAKVLITTLTSTGTNVIEFNASTGSTIREFAFPGAAGLSLAYSADSIFIGDYLADAVHQFDRSDTSPNPTPIHTYTGVASSGFGGGLAVSGDHLLISAAYEGIEITVLGIGITIGSGAAYVYDHTTQTLVQKIDNPTPDGIITLGAPDTFSTGVAVLGDGEFVISDPTDDFNNLLDVGGIFTFDV